MERNIGEMPQTAPSATVRVTAMSFLIIMVDGYDTLMISFIAPLLAKQWALHPTDIGRIFAIGYLGAIIGAVGMGPLADRFGRKPILLAALLLAGATTLSCAAAPSLDVLMALRFVTGIALGAALPAVMALTAEHARSDRRSGTVTIMYIGYPMGAVIGGAATAALLHHGWSAIFICAGIACLLAAALAAALPESRRPQPAVGHLRRRGAIFTDQFADGRLWPALGLWSGLFCLLMLTYFLLSWTPTIIVARGGSPKLAALGGVILNLGGITGALIAAPIINRFGPYFPIAILVATGSVFVALIGQEFAQIGGMMAILFVAGASILGGQLNFPAMTVDLFPPHVRGAGAGWTIGAGRLGSIVGPLAGGALIAAALDPARLFLAAAVPALAAAVALFATGRLQRARRRDGAARTTTEG